MCYVVGVAYLQVLGESASSPDDDSLLKTFIDLGEHCPKFLRPQLEEIIKLSLQVWWEWSGRCGGSGQADVGLGSSVGRVKVISRGRGWGGVLKAVVGWRHKHMTF